MDKLLKIPNKVDAGVPITYVLAAIVETLYPSNHSSSLTKVFDRRRTPIPVIRKTAKPLLV